MKASPRGRTKVGPREEGTKIVCQRKSKVWLKTKSAKNYKSQPLATAAEASVVGGAEGKVPA